MRRPRDGRIEFPIVLGLKAGTNLMGSVMTGRDTHGSGVDAGVLAANLHIVGKRRHGQIELAVAVFRLSVIGHTKTEVKFARGEERGLKIVGVGSVIIEQLRLELEDSGIIPSFGGFQAEFGSDLEKVLTDAVVAEGILRIGTDVELILDRVLEEELRVDVLVEGDRPKEVAEEVEIVVATLIPAFGDVSLRHLERPSKLVQPIVGADRVVLGRDDGFLFAVKLVDGEEAFSWVGSYEIERRRFGQGTGSVMDELRGLNHGAITDVTLTEIGLLGIAKPLVVDGKLLNGGFGLERRNGNAVDKIFLLVENKWNENETWLDFDGVVIESTPVVELD